MRTKTAVIACLILLSSGCAAIAQQEARAVSTANAPRGGHVDLRCLARNTSASKFRIELFIRNPIFGDDVVRESAESLSSMPQGAGSGTAISHEGHILTAAHLIKRDGIERYARVILPDPDNGGLRAYVAETVAIDEERDIAVIKIERHLDDIAPIGGEQELVVGDDFYGPGHPFDLGDLLMRGYVMGIDVEMAGLGHVGMVLDARSGPGASGAGLYSGRSGNLIGVMQGTRPILISETPLPIYDFVRWGANVHDIRQLLTTYGVPFQDGGDSLPACGP